jgi:hypothetical protein
MRMPLKRPKMPDDKPQLDKFKDKARELECDDDEERFKERLGKLVKVKPAPTDQG